MFWNASSTHVVVTAWFFEMIRLLIHCSLSSLPRSRVKFACNRLTPALPSLGGKLLPKCNKFAANLIAMHVA